MFLTKTSWNFYDSYDPYEALHLRFVLYEPDGVYKGHSCIYAEEGQYIHNSDSHSCSAAMF